MSLSNRTISNFVWNFCLTRNLVRC